MKSISHFCNQLVNWFINKPEIICIWSILTLTVIFPILIVIVYSCSNIYNYLIFYAIVLIVTMIILLVPVILARKKIVRVWRLRYEYLNKFYAFVPKNKFIKGLLLLLLFFLRCKSVYHMAVLPFEFWYGDGVEALSMFQTWQLFCVVYFPAVNRYGHFIVDEKGLWTSSFAPRMRAVEWALNTWDASAHHTDYEPMTNFLSLGPTNTNPTTDLILYNNNYNNNLLSPIPTNDVALNPNLTADNILYNNDNHLLSPIPDIPEPVNTDLATDIILNDNNNDNNLPRRVPDNYVALNTTGLLLDSNNNNLLDPKPANAEPVKTSFTTDLLTYKVSKNTQSNGNRIVEQFYFYTEKHNTTNTISPILTSALDDTEDDTTDLILFNNNNNQS